MSSQTNNDPSDTTCATTIKTGTVINVGPELDTRDRAASHGRTDEPTKVRHGWIMSPDGVIRLSALSDSIEHLSSLERGDGVRFRGILDPFRGLPDVYVFPWNENTFIESASTSGSIIPPEGWDSGRAVKRGSEDNRFNIQAEVREIYQVDEEDDERHLALRCLDTNKETERKTKVWAKQFRQPTTARPEAGDWVWIYQGRVPGGDTDPQNRDIHLWIGRDATMIPEPKS